MKKKKDEKKRRRNRSINFRLTPQDEIRIRERITVVGIPMQEFFLNAFTDMKIEIKWGMFESERLAIELKRLGSVLESIDIESDEAIREIMQCRICLEEITDMLKRGHQMPEEML